MEWCSTGCLKKHQTFKNAAQMFLEKKNRCLTMFFKHLLALEVLGILDLRSVVAERHDGPQKWKLSIN